MLVSADIKAGPRGYKKIACSAEHEISNAHKYKNIKEFSIFMAKISLECTGILTFMSRKNFMLSWVEHAYFL